jgi:hypothetical protein
MADDENREEEFLGDLGENYEAEEEKVDDEVDDPVRRSLAKSCAGKLLIVRAVVSIFLQ